MAPPGPEAAAPAETVRSFASKDNEEAEAAACVESLVVDPLG